MFSTLLFSFLDQASKKVDFLRRGGAWPFLGLLKLA